MEADMALTTMEVVRFLIDKGPGRTQYDLAQAIFGDSGYQQRVNVECDMLVRSGAVERRGAGRHIAPYRYYPANRHA